ncbi:MAG TPA: PD-(D/E)XK nuclease family protein [Pusillimonas sp.]|uniref:PD-(D/E)XK nuclease family protein n=1 Tax=unclassified Pusillimonas TaxID=2640016 RepID=UPI002637DC0C|nr:MULTISPECIES: PD-(D/E)XK nuclease family protein [unclassified Pusillimonas]HLU19318.1 PD-(D/E)XK nuclease family protein [Pusillimonas sp.]
MENTLPSLTLDDLAAESADTLVLTVNNRYARRILASLSARLDQHRRVMALPAIVPFRSWLRQAGDELSFLPQARLASHVIDVFGSRSLWQQVICQLETENPLLDSAQAARLAMEADQVMSEWGVAVLPEEETADHQRFIQWHNEYRRRLDELDAEDATLGYERVCEAVESGLLPNTYARLVLAGFAEISPRMQRLVSAFQQQGVELLTLRVDATPSTHVCRVPAPDPDTEWRLAAQWASRMLREYPNKRFAIIAAQLEADAALAHRVLREALAGRPGHSAPGYNIAVARPLAQWPLVRASLAWLRLLSQLIKKGKCRPAEAGEALLLGYCMAHLAEADGRARIDAALRADAVVSLSVSEFARRLAQLTPQLAQAWSACFEHALENSSAATIETWVARFRYWLQQLGFPGETAMSSHAFQTIEAFERVLERLAQQTVVMGRVDLFEAVAALSTITMQTPFQPQRDPAARLDVQGFLEAEGGQWDGVWILGLTDEVLPSAPKPNPLLPLSALKRANAPRATPERELHWARTMFNSLLCTAPSVWVSHALLEGERQLRASPLIAAYPSETHSWQWPDVHVAVIESLTDDKGPALSPDTITKGGIAVIDTQARNPLWAFVRYRLGASQMSDYAEMASQSARGIFLHRSMELVCKNLLNSDTLRTWHDQGKLADLIQDSVECAANEWLFDYGMAVRELEINRAAAILHDWFELERHRGEFSVQAIEQSYEWTRGPLRLTLRLDRIDQLPDGSLAVIDYKTGGASIDPRSDWMRDRPVGLQLPFYAAVLAQDQAPVSALLMVRLHARGIEVKGLADGDCGFTGPAHVHEWPAFEHLDWDGLMAQWRRHVELVADEYASGLAANYVLRPDDLNYCDVMPFLRLNEEVDHVI